MLLSSSRIRDVEIYLPYDSDEQIQKIILMCKSVPLIGLFVLHGCSFLETDVSNVDSCVFLIKEKIEDNKICGKVSKNGFNINPQFYSESLNHNTCLFKKISIDKNGDIKNCPSFSLSFGNIQNMPLENSLKAAFFKKQWNITKDQINVCKVCEFRHICSDCRANLSGPYEKPSGCNYDPYTGLWAEEKPQIV